MKNLLSLVVLITRFWLTGPHRCDVLLIPDSLRKNADLVVRTNETILEIKSPGKAVLKERHAYTILNESAADYADYVSRYDKFTSINYINASLYDAMGKEIEAFVEEEKRYAGCKRRR